MEGGAEPGQASGGKVDFRLGAALRSVIPIRGPLRAVVGIDAELAPAGLGNGPSRRIDPDLPVVPAYGAGIAVGVEAAL